MPRSRAKDRANIETVAKISVCLSSLGNHKSIISNVIQKFLERGMNRQKLGNARPQKRSNFAEKIVRNCERPFQQLRNCDNKLRSSTVRKKQSFFSYNLLIESLKDHQTLIFIHYLRFTPKFKKCPI